jgi:hypothetical protein
MTDTIVQVEDYPRTFFGVLSNILVNQHYNKVKSG